MDVMEIEAVEKRSPGPVEQLMKAKNLENCGQQRSRCEMASSEMRHGRTMYALQGRIMSEHLRENHATSE